MLKGDEKTKRPGGGNFEDDKGLKVLAIIMGIGLLAIFCISFFMLGKGKPPKLFWSFLGLSVIISLAATIIGGFLGFLFGIPRSLQNTSNENLQSNGNTNGGGQTTRTRSYKNNTNLEDISDWLTKIIVGVSLIQLTKIIQYFNTLCKSLAISFDSFLSFGFAFTYSGGMILFYSICGFLVVYLWAKIYLLQQLYIVERQIDNSLTQQLAEVKDELTKVSADKDNKLELAILQRKIEEFNRERNKISVQESLPTIKDILAIAKPNPVTVFNDCQKNRWGGLSSVDGYEATASVVQDTTEPDRFHVVVHVTTGDPQNHPITGNVYFFLHDTYFPESIRMVEAFENEATLEFESYEAFTIGIVLNNGNVKLEIDMNEQDGIPDTYKYNDKLDTIDRLKEKADLISKKEGNS